VTADGPDLGERSSSAGPDPSSGRSSSSELSSASAQNLDPRTTRLSGSGERGEGGAPVDFAAPSVDAPASPRESPAESRELILESHILPPPDGSWATTVNNQGVAPVVCV
jgi:hypothetical protein